MLVSETQPLRGTGHVVERNLNQGARVPGGTGQGRCEHAAGGFVLDTGVLELDSPKQGAPRVGGDGGSEKVDGRGRSKDQAGCVGAGPEHPGGRLHRTGRGPKPRAFREQRAHPLILGPGVP